MAAAPDAYAALASMGWDPMSGLPSVRSEAKWAAATMLIRAVGVSPADGDEAWKAGVRRLYHKIMSEGLGTAVGWNPPLREVGGGPPQTDLRADDWVVWARMLAGKLDFEDPKAVIRELKAERRDAYKPMPPLLAEADAALDRGDYDPEPKRGRPPADEGRNAAIWICFLALKLYGFQETRDPNSSRESACSIVADIVVTLEEPAIYKIISRWKKLAGIPRRHRT